MNLCSDGHDEVCFDQRNCPVCDVLKTMSDMEDEIYALKETIGELKAGQNG
jgi:hypothetical protein